MTEKRTSPTPTRRPRPTPGAAARARRRRGGPRSSTPPRHAPAAPPAGGVTGRAETRPRDVCSVVRRAAAARGRARGPGAVALAPWRAPHGQGGHAGARQGLRAAIGRGRQGGASGGKGSGCGHGGRRQEAHSEQAEAMRAAAPTSAFSVLRRGRAARLCGAEGHALPPRESPFPGSTGAPRPLRGNRSSGSWALGTPVGNPQVQGHGLGCGKGLNLGQETSKMEGRMGGGCLQTNVPAPTSPRPLRRGKARDAEG